MPLSPGQSSLLHAPNTGVEETTRKLILGVAGHIDHGKTALVRALTGINTDRLPEEQRRGMTIDIGFAHLDLPGVSLGIIDAPGHERFIRNMLAGACAVDVAMLVIAADDSVMPQTIEHLSILELLGVRNGLIVITKTDLVDESMLELVESDARSAASETFLAQAPIVRASSKSENGLDEVKHALEMVCQVAHRRDNVDLFRLAVDRSFVMPGIGTIVTGTVRSGSVSVGDSLEWSPVGRAVKVKGLQTHGVHVDSVSRGQRAAILLSNVHHSEINRGHELAQHGYLKPTKLLTVRLHAMKQSPRPIKHHSRVRLHLGAGEVMANVRLFGPNAIEPGHSEFAQLLCAEPVAATGQQAFVIRSESPVVTIGGGLVLLASSPQIDRNDADTLQWLDRLEQGDDASRCESVIRLFNLEHLAELDLCREADVSIGVVTDALEKLEQSGAIKRIPASGHPHFIHREVWEELSLRIMIALARYHEREPMAPAVPIGQLEQAIHGVEGSVVRAVVADLIALKNVVGTMQSIALPTHRPPLDSEQTRLRDAIITAHQGAAFSPPSASQLAASHNASHENIELIITLCAQQGELVHLGASLFLHRDRHQEMLVLLREKLLAGDGLTISMVRDLLDTSRKYAVPICEHLDRIQFTKRRGDLRVLNPAFAMK